MNRICTIIAINYLPQAMALLESTRKVYPEIEFFVLIIDGKSKDIPYLPSAKILLPEDLKIPLEWLSQMRSYYDAMELATSLKPFLLNTLLDNEIETVTYLDPDILLFSELTEGMEAARDFGIALTPHRLTPSNILKSDFLELGLLQYGIFNLGYIAVGQKSRQMLDWWGLRLRWYCTKFPNDAPFTDQKWINFIPALFDFKPVKSKGYNLASWNLDERPLSLVSGKFFAAGDPLVFIHFAQMSGVLAAGRKTDHWEQSLDISTESRISLQLISGITDDYSRQLVDFGLIIRKSDKATMDDYKLSYHAKKALIRESIATERRQGTNPTNYVNPTSRKRNQNMSLLLERSSALNGFRDGLVLDRRKFFKILQRFLKS